ncbi:beta-lactamase family protein [Mycobacterium xenopi 4042]|uniref:Beta-lactamase family protein n=1 Tax=Mycobacterium xenopi 4042 TaxID=1299334 RepID=X8C0A0_MYCXE|nr:beta-lactamase family protein [Mycobacterium xenopi 4042]
MVGVLVSRIEGKPFHQVLDERILQPLGMCDTGFSSQPRSAPERQPCTGWMTTTGCDTT